MTDKFETYASGLESPASDAATVTPNDGTDLTTHARALYIGGAGNVKVDTVAGSTVTFTALPVGFILPVRVRRVHSTDTTATNIIAMW